MGAGIEAGKSKRVARKERKGGLRAPAICPMRNLTYSFFYVIPPVSQSGTRPSMAHLWPTPTIPPHSTLCIAAKIEFQILSLSLSPLFLLQYIPLCIRIFASLSRFSRNWISFGHLFSIPWKNLYRKTASISNVFSFLFDQIVLR